MENHLPRKLAAILYADVAGYSRLTGEDEEGTHRLLSAYLDAFTATIQGYEGRVVHFAGDAILAEFPAVSQALTCAASVQRDLEARNAELPEARRVQFRIGVNLGEVIVDRDDVYGDGVNVAARLETLAEPGGICVSESVRSAAGSRLPLAYEFLGEQEVKNIREPVRAYRVALEPGATLQAPSTTGRPARGFPRRTAAVILAGLVLAVAAALSWLAPWAPSIEAASVEQMAFPLPDEPSIAVLPFDNLSDDPDQDYLSDGITESLIIALSKIPKMFVIAPEAAFAQRDAKVARAAEALGVRYVLQGSVQRADERIRVNAQLADALTGERIWAERYDRAFEDIFALQDDITQKVATAMEVALTEGEQARVWRRQTDNPKAYEHFLRGMDYIRRFTKTDNGRAQHLFEQAVELDPNFGVAWVNLARTHYFDGRFGWSDEPKRSIAHAKEYALKALALDDTHADTHAMLGNVALIERRYENVLAHDNRALDLNPTAQTLALCAVHRNYLGRPEEALGLVKSAMRLSPHHHPSWYLFALGQSHRLLENYDRSIEALKGFRNRNPDSPHPYLALAVAYFQAGQTDDARAEVAKALERAPGLAAAGFRRSLLYKDPAESDRILDALRSAGLPE